MSGEFVTSPGMRHAFGPSTLQFIKSLVECVFRLSSTPSLRGVSTKLDRITIADFGTQIGLGRAQVKELLMAVVPNYPDLP